MTALSHLAGRLPNAKLPAVRILNVLLIAALAAVASGVYLAMRTTTTSTQGAVRTAAVSRGVVLSSVSATGSLQPTSQVNVNFDTSGKLTQIKVVAGQRVVRGQVLGVLDSTSDRAALSQAAASLEIAKANLQQTLAGETPQQRAADALSITQSSMQVSTARASVATAQRQLAQDARTTAQGVTQAGTSTSLKQAEQQLRTDRGNERGAVAKLTSDKAQLSYGGTTYTSATDAVAAATAAVHTLQAKQQADQQQNLTLQLQQTTDNQKLSADKASLASAQANNDAAAISEYTAAVNNDQTAINNDALALAQLQQTTQADGYALTQAQSSLSTLTGLQATVNGDEQSIASLEAKIVSDRNAITAAKAALANSVSAAKSNQAATLTKDRQAIQSARQQLASAELGVQTTKASNAVKQAPAQAATLMQLRAAVLQAQTNYDTAKQTLAYTTLRAPEAGTVASVSGTVGQQVSGSGTSSSSSASSSASSSSAASSSGSGSSSGFVTLLGKGMQVSAAFAESDAAKIRVGQPATVTVSALPTQELAAHVVSVGVVGSSSSGVVEYAVLFALDRTEPLLKSGMSANVSVTTAESDNVLNVPNAAVTGSGANARVTVVTNGVQKATPVVAGLKGDTNTQIISGVTVGQQVVTSTGATLFSSGGTGTTSTTTTPSGRARFFGGGGFGGGFGG